MDENVEKVFSKTELQKVIEQQIAVAARNPNDPTAAKLALEGARIWADHEKSQVELLKAQKELEGIKYKADREGSEKQKDRKQEWVRIGIIAVGSAVIAWIGNDYKMDSASRFFGLLNRKPK